MATTASRPLFLGTRQLNILIVVSVDLRYVPRSRRNAAERQRCGIRRAGSRGSPVTVHAMARQTGVRKIARRIADRLPISRARRLVRLPRRLEQSSGVLHPIGTFDGNGLAECKRMNAQRRSRVFVVEEPLSEDEIEQVTQALNNDPQIRANIIHAMDEILRREF